jgi:putative protease
MGMGLALELVCPAGNPAALRAAVDAGADAVYVGFNDATNARNFPGLNFSRKEMAEGLDYAHSKKVKLFVAINTFPHAGDRGPWLQAIDDAAALQVDAVILADIGLLAYATDRFPDLRRHLSVQASASSADSIAFFSERFGVRRVVLPRVLTVGEIASLNAEIDVETEVFAFGGLCVMAEGRCSLSSYATGQSPNLNGVCSPASAVVYEREGGDMVSRLAGLTINRFPEGEAAGYPTLCKGRFSARGAMSYLFEEPVSLNTIDILPDLAAAGVSALKIEGRQRGRAYVAEAVSAFRKAIAGLGEEGGGRARLVAVSEGTRQTEGVYRRSWR